MRFGLLGALYVRQDDGHQATLRAPMERTLLAILLLRPREVLSNAYLVDLLWQGLPPPNAKASLHNHIRRLRQALGEQGDRIQTRQPGYLFDVQDNEVDIRIFEDFVRCGRARAHERQWAEAAEMMDDALALWRGDPLADITPNALTEQEVPRLQEMRIDALQWRVEAELAAGRHEELVPELQRLISAHPLRERLHGQLMLAYHRSGRQAEALAAFREARRIFVADLGIEPSEELRRLHRQILAGEVAEAAERPLPAQLPPDLSSFSGRGDELARLDAAARHYGKPCVLVISGPGGIGKTSLAVHWAHRVRGRFPDGQLYVDLRGFSGSAAVSSAEALRGFLGALGIPADRTPSELAELSGLFRSVVASKRILVFLDNARDADQVRPLLPGAGGCLTVVTSRNRLAGMVAGDNAHSVALDVLSSEASLELLASRVGEDRLAGEPEAAARIVDRCAGLPLALAVAAARVLTLPDGSLAGLAAELSTTDGGLAALAVDDSAMDVRSVFASSYRLVHAPAQRLFRMSGVLPGSRLSIAVMASVAARSVPETRRLLAEIAGVGLVTQLSVDVYAIHDLVRSYAAELLEADPDEHQAATSRMFAYYIHSAHSGAVLMAPPQMRRQKLTGPPEGVIAFEPATVDEAGGWFASEYTNLLAVADAMRSLEADEELSDLVWPLTVYGHRVGLYSDQIVLQQWAAAACGRKGDAKGVADAHRGAGRALIQLDRLDEADEQLRRGLDVYLSLNLMQDASAALLDLAWVFLRREDVKTALEHAERALALATASRPYALNTVGWCHLQLGDYLRALSTCEEALVLHERRADLRGQAETWDSIAVVRHRLGRFAEAMTAFDQALSLYRANWDWHGEADTLDHQAEAAADAGLPQRAAQLWRHSLRIYESLDHPDSERVARRLEEAQER